MRAEFPEEKAGDVYKMNDVCESSNSGNHSESESIADGKIHVLFVILEKFNRNFKKRRRELFQSDVFA